jgi:hypothetical protein
MIDTGNRVRVGITEEERRTPLTRHSQRVTGIVRGISPDTLFLEVVEGTAISAIPRARIVDVELSLGAPSRLLSAKELGSSLGLLATLILVTDKYEPRGWKAAAIGAGGGFAAGAVIGLVRPYERWQLAWIPE